MFVARWTCKANNIAVAVLQPNRRLSGCENKMRFFDHFSNVRARKRRSED